MGCQSKMHRSWGARRRVDYPRNLRNCVPHVSSDAIGYAQHGALHSQDIRK
jgi:hypothetical protein